MTKDLMLRKGKNGHSKTWSKQTYKSMKTVFPQWVKCVENQKHADVFPLVLWNSKNNCIKIWWGYNRTTLYRRGFQTNYRNASKSSFVRLKIIWKWQKVGNLWVPSAFVYTIHASSSSQFYSTHFHSFYLTLECRFLYGWTSLLHIHQGSQVHEKRDWITF